MVTTSTILAIDLPDETATGVLAADLARLARRGDVIGLSGELGSGKTSFARAFIGARLDPGEVPSPTFTLVEIYQSLTGPALWHFDLYRLERPDDAYELGIEEAFAEGIALIEWPERLGPLLPREHLRVTLALGRGADERRALIEAPSSWSARIGGLRRG
ncbi:MAG TPA: tRNA (adenosine(37)-N6)-threonylcarbamoyltransferase complex ATPase subunit type 1 TsaE [Stellaceae bacterium]|nr:tRNA (adenosine(37)-N6)-threonylcarbamoyltransferase complex ATPase subunit type 1 TsaE [Stellaceae bacterium]